MCEIIHLKRFRENPQSEIEKCFLIKKNSNNTCDSIGVLYVRVNLIAIITYVSSFITKQKC